MIHLSNKDKHLIYIFLCFQFSSKLYHACDSDSAHSFCIMPLNTLHYADHYFMLLTLWITLVSLSNLSKKLKNFLHFLGTIFLSLIVEYDRTSIWSLVISITVGLFVLISSCVSIQNQLNRVNFIL